MKKRILVILTLVAMVALSVVALAPKVSAYYTCAEGPKKGELVDSKANCPGDTTDDNALMNTMTNVVNVIIGIVGFITIIMIIVGGIMYATSAGDAGKAKKAKDTIIYGLIGLVVAILAFAIVNFVLGNL
ncbi:hypothetical protein IJI94_03600 [Candidatus Saccharibacteria bacterium]|nr:hypothetical protein [Candidatus Saccharibacteria bacterium]